MLGRPKKEPADLTISGFFLGFFLLFSLLLVSNNSFAEAPAPFLTRNQSPFSLIYGLPLASQAKLLEAGQSRWINSLNISNTLNAQSTDTDSLLVDIETRQLNLIYDFSIKENWMLRFQLPLIQHSGGFLDSYIDKYHQALGLPENLRPEFPRDEIHIIYEQQDIEQININSQQSSLGDISIQLAWQATQSEQSNLSYWLSLKLPTGDESRLTGSGATDLAAWASLDYRLNATRWFYGQSGILYMGDGEVLQNFQNSWALFAVTGIKFEPWKNIELKTQLDMHSSLYDSDIKFLGHVIQLTFGGSYHFNRQHILDFAVVEDLNSGASPDVNFNITWTINY